MIPYLRRRACRWHLLLNDGNGVRVDNGAPEAQPSHPTGSAGFPLSSPDRLSTAPWAARLLPGWRLQRWRLRCAWVRSRSGYSVCLSDWLREDGAFPSSYAVGLVLSSGAKVARRRPGSKWLEFILLEMIRHMKLLASFIFRVTLSLSDFHFGGVLVSTDGLRWGLHAADDASPRNNRIKP